MTQTINELVTLSTEQCCACGVTFALPQQLQTSLRRTGSIFYCPSGHAQNYTKTEADKLRGQLNSKEAELRASKCATLGAARRADEISAQLAQSQRQLKRVHRGVCPCCKRTFENLARHMATQHKDETTKS